VFRKRSERRWGNVPFFWFCCKAPSPGIKFSNSGEDSLWLLKHMSGHAKIFVTEWRILVNIQIEAWRKYRLNLFSGRIGRIDYFLAKVLRHTRVPDCCSERAG